MKTRRRKQNKFGAAPFNPTQEDLNRAIKDFDKKGGKIEKIESPGPGESFNKYVTIEETKVAGIM